jgi:hypothetical protein
VKTGIILAKERGSLLLDNVIESTLVQNEVVMVTEIVRGQVIARTAENKRTLQGRIGILKV